MLDASHLTRRFGARLAVEDVSFHLAPGEILALLGPNGAGKTTTMRMLAGLIAPSSGDVRVGGESMGSKRAGALRARIGLLTEAPGLWDRLSVRQNLITYARLYGIPDPAAAVAEALRTFDISGRANDAAAQLSKGLRQRVALARAILHKPAIVLLDEPTSGLDPESARDVRQLILRLRDEGRAVLLSTHNLDEVERVADRVAVLRTRLIALDTPSALGARLFGRRVRIVVRGNASKFVASLREMGLSDVRTSASELLVPTDHDGTAGAPDTPAIVRRLVAEGADIESVTADDATLEDVYVRLLQAGAPSTPPPPPAGPLAGRPRSRPGADLDADVAAHVPPTQGSRRVP